MHLLDTCQKWQSLTHKFIYCLLCAPLKLIKLLLHISPQVPVWFLWSNVDKWILNNTPNLGYIEIGTWINQRKARKALFSETALTSFFSDGGGAVSTGSSNFGSTGGASLAS